MIKSRLQWTIFFFLVTLLRDVFSEPYQDLRSNGGSWYGGSSGYGGNIGYGSISVNGANSGFGGSSGYVMGSDDIISVNGGNSGFGGGSGYDMASDGGISAIGDNSGFGGNSGYEMGSEGSISVIDGNSGFGGSSGYEMGSGSGCSAARNSIIVKSICGPWRPAVSPWNPTLPPPPPPPPQPWPTSYPPYPDPWPTLPPPRPDICQLEGQTCGVQATNPPLQYGTCCSGLTCHHHLRGGVGTCIKGEQVCKKEGESCGFHAINPPQQHGDCCDGFTCNYFGVGGAGKCEKDDEGSDDVKNACDDDDLVLDLNLEQLKLLVAETSKLLVDFYKPPCVACQMFDPEFKKAAKESKIADTGIIFAKVNIENCPDIQQELSISTYPRVLLWANGFPGDQNSYPGNPQRYFKEYGLNSQQLENWLRDRMVYAQGHNTTRQCHDDDGNNSFFDQFQCDDGRCIPAANVCDSENLPIDQQCVDQSDEKFCSIQEQLLITSTASYDDMR